MDPSLLLSAAGLGLGGLGLGWRAFVYEPTAFEVTRHDLPIPGLPAPWAGQRIVHLTDLHYGNPRSEFVFRRTVELANAEDADLVLITGDFLLRRAREAPPCAAHLARLRARQGVIAVLGDHDFDERTRRPITGLPAALQDAGVRLLRNEWLELPGGLRLAGVDPTTARVQAADLQKAVRGLDSPPHLLLAHSPDIIHGAALRDIPVVLCGHTHGGQVVVPFYGPPLTHTKVGRRFASGWSTHQGTRMYTSRGLGSHFSLRFLCRPELPVFTLRSAEPPNPRR